MSEELFKKRKIKEEKRENHIYISISQVLSTKADGVLLVVRAGSTKREMVFNSVDLIKKVQGKVIGTVLNGVENKKNNYYYYGE